MARRPKHALWPEVMAWRRHRRRAATRLRALREQSELTQLELADRSGITHEAISRLELAHCSPWPDTLAKLAAALGVAPADLVASPPVDLAPPAPSGTWLTVDEAARALARSPESVRDLLRAGRLAPAVREAVGGKGHPRWLVDAAAVERFRAPRHRHPPRPSQDPPPGYLGLDEVVARTGVPHTTLLRWLDAGVAASVRVGGRRWVPEADVAAIAAHRNPEGTG